MAEVGGCLYRCAGHSDRLLSAEVTVVRLVLEHPGGQVERVGERGLRVESQAATPSQSVPSPGSCLQVRRRGVLITPRQWK